jgi:hypothetical protein
MNWMIEYLSAVWGLTGEMAPYLLFGFLMAGILSVFVRTSFVEKHLGRPGFMQTLKATFVGVPMPLCSCGVIPVAASLRRHGAAKGSTAAFLASTPQTGVDSIAATWGMMSPFFALVRVLAAFASGIMAGVLVDLGDPEDNQGKSGGAAGEEDSHEPVVRGGRERLKAVFRYGFVTLPADIGRSLVVGLLIAGLISVLIPESFLADRLNHMGLAFLLMTAVAIPMYVCSTGSIPVAVAFIQAGVSPGAALVFLIAGPATNAATISTLWKILGRRTVVIYLIAIISMAWLFGFLLNSVPIDLEGLRAMHEHAAPGSAWLYQASAVFLAAVLINALRPRRAKACPHCAK